MAETRAGPGGNDSAAAMSRDSIWVAIKLLVLWASLVYCALETFLIARVFKNPRQQASGHSCWKPLSAF